MCAVDVANRRTTKTTIADKRSRRPEADAVDVDYWRIDFAVDMTDSMTVDRAAVTAVAAAAPARRRTARVAQSSRGRIATALKCRERRPVVTGTWVGNVTTADEDATRMIARSAPINENTEKKKQKKAKTKTG